MTQLYKAMVTDSMFRSDGIGWFSQNGSPQTVDGTPMVRLPHGTLVPAAGWHADRADAIREAADRVEELGRRLITQAGCMRADADKGATK